MLFILDRLPKPSFSSLFHFSRRRNHTRLNQIIKQKQVLEYHQSSMASSHKRLKQQKQVESWRTKELKVHEELSSVQSQFKQTQGLRHGNELYSSQCNLPKKIFNEKWVWSVDWVRTVEEHYDLISKLNEHGHESKWITIRGTLSAPRATWWYPVSS